MTDRIKDIDKIFSMFHDFEIIGLKVDGNILTMGILLPWSKMWNEQKEKNNDTPTMYKTTIAF